MAKIGLRDPGDLPDDVKDCLLRGSEYYMYVKHLSASYAGCFSSLCACHGVAVLCVSGWRRVDCVRAAV